MSASSSSSPPRFTPSQTIRAAEHHEMHEYQTLQKAFDQAGDHLPVFARDISKKGGFKRFSTGGYYALYYWLSHLPRHDHNHYEIIREGRPCKLYADLDAYLHADHPRQSPDTYDLYRIEHRLLDDLIVFASQQAEIIDRPIYRTICQIFINIYRPEAERARRSRPLRHSTLAPDDDAASATDKSFYAECICPVVDLYDLGRIETETDNDTDDDDDMDDDEFVVDTSHYAPDSLTPRQKALLYFGSVVRMDSSNEHKASRHITWPLATMTNNYHCGAFMRRFHRWLETKYRPTVDATAAAAADDDPESPTTLVDAAEEPYYQVVDYIEVPTDRGGGESPPPSPMSPPSDDDDAQPTPTHERRAIWLPIFDMGVYTRNRCWRLPASTKRGRDRHLVYVYDPRRGYGCYEDGTDDVYNTSRIVTTYDLPKKHARRLTAKQMMRSQELLTLGLVHDSAFCAFRTRSTDIPLSFVESTGDRPFSTSHPTRHLFDHTATTAAAAAAALTRSHSSLAGPSSLIAWSPAQPPTERTIDNWVHRCYDILKVDDDDDDDDSSSDRRLIFRSRADVPAFCIMAADIICLMTHRPRGWFPELIRFIPDTMSLKFTARDRHCEIAQATHDSNHVHYQVDLIRGRFRQHCYARQCQGHKSAWRSIDGDDDDTTTVAADPSSPLAQTRRCYRDAIRSFHLKLDQKIGPVVRAASFCPGGVVYESSRRSVRSQIDSVVKRALGTWDGEILQFTL